MIWSEEDKALLRIANKLLDVCGDFGVDAPLLELPLTLDDIERIVDALSSWVDEEKIQVQENGI